MSKANYDTKTVLTKEMVIIVIRILMGLCTVPFTMVKCSTPIESIVL